jgi:hypothetical protein
MKLKEIRVFSTKDGWKWKVTPLDDTHITPSLQPTKLVYYASVNVPDKEAADLLLGAMVDLSLRKIEMIQQQITGLLRATQEQ